ncbi:MAG: type II toxin-antitoxin system Phd/YefM family antitoxin [Deltaproteobacteria bacterium]|nr:type II toxin-antitoxin system Phd/YefM family antitoxin [Deltaproteobacteria bacterium]
MFEIHDERLGRLKIFNVTEARANFAEVLKEDEAKVVVTRHGRPTKIMIRYDEYLSLMGAAAQHLPGVLAEEAASTASVIIGSEDEKPHSPGNGALPPKWVQRESEQLVSSLKSLFNK